MISRCLTWCATIVRRLDGWCGAVWNDIPRKRRAVPFVVATIVAVPVTTPLWVDWMTDRQANLLTFFFCSVVFLFKAFLFGRMRARMTGEQRALTVFGWALIDFFTGLIALAIVFAVVYGALFAAVARNWLLPDWFAIASRASIVWAGALILACGVAVEYEMRRVAGRLAVHVDGNE